MNVFHVARKSAFHGIGIHALPPFGFGMTIPSARGSHDGEVMPGITRRMDGLEPAAASALSMKVQLYTPALGSSSFHGNVQEIPAHGDDCRPCACEMVN